MRSSTTTLIEALRILSRDIQSQDGVANLAIAEAAGRMEVLKNLLRRTVDLGALPPDLAADIRAALQ
jgi:hypothetical protein